VPELTPQERRVVEREFRDHATFCRESLSINDKLGKTVPFELGPAQQKLEALIDKIRKRGRPVRIVALKARQVWVSAGTAAEFFHDCAFVPGQKALVVAHEADASRNIFGYYQQFQQKFKAFREVIGTLGVLRNNDYLLAWQGGGYIKVATANNLKTGRSYSLRFLHLSEFAFWRDAKTLMTGLMQAVPNDPHTIVVVESTANGQGNEFHRMCLEAMDPTSNSEWEFFFFAWWEHPEYSIRPAVLGFASDAEFEHSLGKTDKARWGNECELRDKYSLTLSQLAWRRWSIQNNCGGSVAVFHQEYPSNPEEAFLASGRPRFSLEHLNKMPAAKREAADAGTAGELIEYYNGPKLVTAFMPGEGGPLVVYKKPAAGKLYVAGVDVAEGIDVSLTLGAGDPDYTVVCILDQSTGEQVAKLRGRLEPAAAAEYSARLFRWYAWAYVVPEANGPGIAYLEGLLREEYPPALIYHRRPLPDEMEVDGDHTTLSRIGWKTTSVTRVQLISNHDRRIREFSVIINDPHTLMEHINFVIKPGGRAEHQDNQHDDEVIACALAGEGLECAPADRTIGGVHALKPQASRGVKPGGSVGRYGGRRQSGEIDRGRLVRI
jgi:hypothetical protein